MKHTTDGFSVVIARQPIFDRDHQVIAYELLFRQGSTDTNAEVNAFSGDMATTKVITHAFLELGIERVIDDKTAFVNLTRNFILSDDPLPFAKNRVVLELLEDIEIDDEILRAVERLVDQGYQIALDDFVFDESFIPLLSLCRIVKLDVLALTDEQLRAHVTQLRSYPVTLLAEKIETHAAYQRCRELGFDLFQGYFFSKPDIIADKPIPANTVVLLELIQKLQNPDIELEEIESLISQDITLSYKLLRLLNSAAVGMRNVDSIKKAVLTLGLKAIKTWTTLIIVSEICAEDSDELLSHGLIRAKMLEQLAPYYGCQADSGFLVGLFSIIDSMLARPIEDIIDTLPLNQDIQAALLNQSGSLGQMLNDMHNYEHGDWDKLDEKNVSFQQMSDSYIAATEWTIQTRQIV